MGGSQNVSGDSAVDFPDDVALRVRPGAVLMLNAHYLNTTADDLDAQVRINLWTIPEEQLVHEGDILFWYNVFIEVPEMGASRAHMRCTVPEDITLTTMQSHMHARGVGYSANVVGDAPFYMNDHWENVPVMTFPEGKTIAGGSTVEYWCDYDNAEARTVYQGPRSTDEMCMLIGSYYPAQPGLGNCAADPERPWQTTSLGADWVGDGSASCAETLGCVQAGAEADDFFQHLQGCVAHSDPAVSCVLLSFSDGEDPMSACSPEITTCLSM